MSEFTEKKPGDTTFQLSGVFCFYSRVREPGYSTQAFKMGEGFVAVNYFGTMLSDGTPGGLASNTLVRPDQADSYVLIGKLMSNPGGPPVVMPVTVEEEVAHQQSTRKNAGPSLR